MAVAQKRCRCSDVPRAVQSIAVKRVVRALFCAERRVEALVEVTPSMKPQIEASGSS